MAQRTVIFADEGNVLGSLRVLNRRPDWIKLRDYLAADSKGRQLLEMILYVGLPPNMPEFQDRRTAKERFLYWAETNGFLVVRKDGSPTEEGRYKSNVDVLMAINAMEFAVDSRPDIVVLITGDNDFAHLALKLRRRGIRVEVAGVRETIGGALRASSNGLVDLTALVDEFPVLSGQATAIGAEDVFD